MKIEIITTSYLGMGGDCVSHYLARFAHNPTLDEFAKWLLEERKREWGEVFLSDKNNSWTGKLLFEYRFGKTISMCPDYNELKSKNIALTRMDGGYSRQDYGVIFSS